MKNMNAPQIKIDNVRVEKFLNSTSTKKIKDCQKTSNKFEDYIKLNDQKPGSAPKNLIGEKQYSQSYLVKYSLELDKSDKNTLDDNISKTSDQKVNSIETMTGYVASNFETTSVDNLNFGQLICSVFLPADLNTNNTLKVNGIESSTSIENDSSISAISLNKSGIVINNKGTDFKEYGLFSNNLDKSISINNADIISNSESAINMSENLSFEVQATTNLNSISISNSDNITNSNNVNNATNITNADNIINSESAINMSENLSFEGQATTNLNSNVSVALNDYSILSDKLQTNEISNNLNQTMTENKFASNLQTLDNELNVILQQTKAQQSNDQQSNNQDLNEQQNIFNKVIKINNKTIVADVSINSKENDKVKASEIDANEIETNSMDDQSYGNNEFILSDKTGLTSIRNERISGSSKSGTAEVNVDSNTFKEFESSQLAKQMVDKIKYLKSETKESRIIIKLRPEQYGDMQISVTHFGAKISAQIHTDDVSMASLLSENSQLLKDNLSKHGITCENIVVNSNSNSNSTSQGSSDFDNNQWNKDKQPEMEPRVNFADKEKTKEFRLFSRMRNLNQNKINILT